MRWVSTSTFTIHMLAYHHIANVCNLLFWPIWYAIVLIIQHNIFLRRHTTFFLTIEIVIRECEVDQIGQAANITWDKTCELIVFNG